MTYPIELRERAVRYVQEVGFRTEACQIFKISRKTLYKWLRSDSLEPKDLRGIRRRRKLCKDALAKHVDRYPEMLLRERAAHFGVGINTVWVACKVLKMSKKNDTVCGEESRKPDKFSA